MITEQEIVEIGRFQKTHALCGELNCILDIDPEYLEAEKPLIVRIDGIPVPFYCESVRPKGVTSFLVRLKGVDDVEQASEFVNKAIYGLKKDLLDFFETDDEQLVFGDDLVGYEVSDRNLGSLGEVVRVDDSTANVLLVVESPRYGEVFIPYVAGFITGVDAGRKTIGTDLPEGLVNLNEKQL